MVKQFGRFAIDLEKCSWQICATADQGADALSYTVVFLPDDATASIADGIQAGDELLWFRLGPPSTLSDTALITTQLKAERAAEFSSPLSIGPRHDAPSVPILTSYFY